MGKRAQITIFFILAIIVLFTFGFLYYLAREKAQNPLARANEILSSSEGLDSVKNYVESCLGDATKEGLKEIGRQGGFIYESQAKGGTVFLGVGGSLCSVFLPETCKSGSSLIPYRTQRGSDESIIVENVSYAIKMGSFIPPFYPYLGNLHLRDNVDTFGIVKGGQKKGSIIDLCYMSGSNARNLSGAEYSCRDSYSNSKQSIEAYLEYYIGNKTWGCITGNEELKKKGVESISISQGVYFGEEDMISLINYRFYHTSSSGGREKLEKEFTYTLKNMRFKEIYELAYFIVQEDSANIFFNVSSEHDLLTLTRCRDMRLGSGVYTYCLKDGMNVTRITEACPTCEVNRFSNIIQIADKYSLIDGEPYIFQLGSTNRPPALDYISPVIDANTNYFRYLKAIGKTEPLVYHQAGQAQDLLEYNIIIPALESLEIYPYGIDPDEDPLVYIYTKVEGAGYSNEIKVDSQALANRLTGSQLYSSSKRDTSIRTTEEDIGGHYFRLVVYDQEGLYDYQDVKVLVCNNTQACTEYCCQ